MEDFVKIYDGVDLAYNIETPGHCLNLNFEFRNIEDYSAMPIDKLQKVSQTINNRDRG